MLNMDVSHAVCSIFSQLGRGKDKPMAFSFDVRVASHENHDSYHASCSAHILLYAKTENGSVRTFFARRERCFDRYTNVPDEQWENISNHDSCWSDAIRSKLTRIYFDLADEVNVKRKEAGLKEIAPKDMQTMVHASDWDRFFTFVEAEFERDYDHHSFSDWWKVKVNGPSDTTV